MAARAWLTFLAHHLVTIGSRDLAWWQLHRAVPRTAVVAGLVAGLVLALVLTAEVWLVSGLPELLGLGPAAGLVFGMLLGLVAGLASWPAIGVIAWAGRPITDERPQTPAVTFRRDRGCCGSSRSREDARSVWRSGSRRSSSAGPGCRSGCATP